MLEGLWKRWRQPRCAHSCCRWRWAQARISAKQLSTSLCPASPPSALKVSKCERLNRCCSCARALEYHKPHDRRCLIVQWPMQCQANECSALALCAADASPGLDVQRILLECLGTAVVRRLQEVLGASSADTVQLHHVFQKVQDLVADLDARFAQPRGRQAVQDCMVQPVILLLLHTSESTDPGAARLLADLIQRSGGAEANGKPFQAAARRWRDTVLRPDQLPRLSCAMVLAGSSATSLMTVESARQTYAKTPLNSPAIGAHADLLLACLTRSEDPAAGFAATLAGLFEMVGHSTSSRVPGYCRSDCCGQ